MQHVLFRHVSPEYAKICKELERSGKICKACSLFRHDICMFCMFLLPPLFFPEIRLLGLGQQLRSLGRATIATVRCAEVAPSLGAWAGGAGRVVSTG